MFGLIGKMSAVPGERDRQLGGRRLRLFVVHGLFPAMTG